MNSKCKEIPLLKINLNKIKIGKNNKKKSKKKKNL